MLGLNATGSFAVADDGIKHVNPFRRVEDLDTKITNDILATEIENNSVVLSDANSVVITDNNTASVSGSDNTATIRTDNRVR